MRRSVVWLAASATAAFVNHAADILSQSVAMQQQQQQQQQQQHVEQQAAGQAIWRCRRLRVGLAYCL